MLIINTGSGKGKTTAAIGQIIRSLGQGGKVCMVQLFKGEEFYGEQKVLTTLKNLDFSSFAPRHPYCFKNAKPEDVKEQCRQALARVENIARSRKYDLVVLDEFNIALREGFIEFQELLEVLKQFSSRCTLVITGRGAPKALIKRADLVTEMKEIKHPYARGIKARKGIEF